jgi:hypothetical protein
MFELQFKESYNYSRHEAISIPVELCLGATSVPVIANVDTGAAFCIFRAEIAEALGIELARGVRQRFRTANSAFEAYGHEVKIFAFGIDTHSMVYFFADPTIEKNVLGRTGWLDRVRMGLVHHENTIYMDSHD